MSWREELAELTAEYGSSWRDDAACAGMNHELFFPPVGQTTREARIACANCPVQGECLEFAVVTKQTHGVWGGADPKERKEIYDRLKRSGRI